MGVDTGRGARDYGVLRVLWSSPRRCPVSSRCQLLHAWMTQVSTLLPAERVTRCRVLALFSLGMIWAGTVRLHQVATTLPLAVRVPSVERRLRYFLANPRVTVAGLWRPLLPVLLAPWAGREVLLVLDPTPHQTRWTVVWIGIVVHRRVLPVSWRVVPQHDAWPAPLGLLLAAMVAELGTALPAGCPVTVLADRGLAGPAVLDAIQAQGWDIVLRLPSRGDHRLRLAPGATAAGAAGDEGGELVLAAWLAVVGPGWHGAVQIFKDAGWRTGYLTIHQPAAASEPWVLFSTRPGGRQRVREYAKRSRVEATFADGKRRGWGLEQSRVQDPVHLDRLLLVWHLALWWLHALGRQLIRRGGRRQFDRSDRRERSLVQLGRCWLTALLAQGRRPPLLFRATPTGWIARGAP